MIGNLIAVLFLARDAAHKEHLNTKSYAAHMALGDFYEEVVSKADELAEAYEGRHEVDLDIPYLDPEDGDIRSQLKTYLKAVESMRKEAIGDDSALQNIVDEIVKLFLSTNNKLRRFK